MVLSLSSTSTTLWDQMQFQNDPSEFAWVLPVFGPVEIGTSSDALFAELESLSMVSVAGCYSCIGCLDPCTQGVITVTSGPFVCESQDATIEVGAQAVVGPYETELLSSADPDALRAWLGARGFVVPAAVDPMIDAYVAEGADFLAVRLTPGVGVDRMRPIRVTFPGAMPTIPLRMVAAGASDGLPISLFIMSEGAPFVPTSMPWEQLNRMGLEWDWNGQSSNYAEVHAAFYADNPDTWMLESTRNVSTTPQTELVGLAASDPVRSGYGALDGSGAVADAEADMAALYGDMDPSKATLTHLTARLSIAALSGDLTLGTASSTWIFDPLSPYTFSGEHPCGSCPTVCDETGGGTGGGPPAANGKSAAGRGCELGTSPVRSDAGVGLSAAALTFALAAAVRRRRRASPQ